MTDQIQLYRRSRFRFAAAAVGALAVTVVFGTIGDGVEVSDADGLRKVIVDFGHLLVWVLLTIAFTIAAVRGRWSTPSQVAAITAGALYALFLFAVFLWP